MTKGTLYTLQWKGENYSQTVEYVRTERGFLVFKDDNGKKVVARIDSVKVAIK